MQWGSIFSQNDINVVFSYKTINTGIGRLMMQHFCTRVDETGAMAYLETDRPENLGFYEKSGLTVIEKGIVLDIPNWFMSRPGQETL